MLAESKTIYAIKESLSKSIDSESGLIAFKNQILAKSKVSISDNLSNGHLSSNVCMIAASFLNKKPVFLVITGNFLCESDFAKP